MHFLKFIDKKIYRLLNSSKMLKFFYFYHSLFNNHSGNIGFDFSKKKNRKEIIQEIIDKKNYKNYLNKSFTEQSYNY